MPPELKPRGTFAPNEARPNDKLKDMDLEKLQELVEWPSKMGEFTAPQEPEFSPVPEESTEAEPAEVSHEPPASTDEPEATLEAEPAEPAEPEPGTPTDTEPPDEAEILRLRLEAYEAEQRKLEAKLAGRDAGERGYIQQLKRQIEELRAGNGATEPEEGDLDDPAPRPRRSPSPQQDAIASWAVSQAVSVAGAEFTAAHSDFSELQSDIQAYVGKSGFDPQTILLSNDPIAAGREVTRVLQEAYWHVKAERKRAHVAELQKRRADSMRGVEEAKKKAAISAPGSSTPPPKKQKKIEDLSLEELQARVSRFAGQ